MANYEVDPALLAARVPERTTLDLFEGRCFVSLVAFMFRDTRVLGVQVPWHVNFEEVNLRFYVTYDAGNELRRGVAFLKEIVPRAMIALVARNLYGEPYEAWKMSHEADSGRIAYTWSRDDLRNAISVKKGELLGVPAAGSHEEFIIEHYWGYTARGGGRVDQYKVEHPKWELFEAGDVTIDVDMGGTYGDAFAFLSSAKPFSVVLAAGSEVSVYKGKRIS